MIPVLDHARDLQVRVINKMAMSDSKEMKWKEILLAGASGTKLVDSLQEPLTTRPGLQVHSIVAKEVVDTKVDLHIGLRCHIVV